MEQFWPTSISSIVPSTSSVSEESFLFKNKYICLNIHSAIIYTCNCKMPSCENFKLVLCLSCKTLDSISWYEIPVRKDIHYTFFNRLYRLTVEWFILTLGLLIISHLITSSSWKVPYKKVQLKEKKYQEIIKVCIGILIQFSSSFILSTYYR